MNSYWLKQTIDHINQQESIDALESGKILFFPQHSYLDISSELLSEAILDGTRKNISYDPRSKLLHAYKKDIPDLEQKLTLMMQGYADFAYHLIQQALPSYSEHLQWGRTSFRPAQISGRVTSRRKDDKRLHVDSFSASPVYGLRILRVFCNINPTEQPRVWNIGEPFSQVLYRFAPQIPAYSKLKAKVLRWIKATKTLRSPYDHYMLHLHDRMKCDDVYQGSIDKIRVEFPAHSSWIVYTDQVSHAALSGQHLLEQTFYLAVDKMANPDSSPLHQWGKIRDVLS